MPIISPPNSQNMKFNRKIMYLTQELIWNGYAIWKKKLHFMRVLKKYEIWMQCQMSNNGKKSKKKEKTWSTYICEIWWNSSMHLCNYLWLIQFNYWVELFFFFVIKVNSHDLYRRKIVCTWIIKLHNCVKHFFFPSIYVVDIFFLFISIYGNRAHQSHIEIAQICFHKYFIWICIN